MSNLRKSTKQRIAITAFTVAGILSFSATFAANPEPVVVEVQFVDPITITEVNALQFGLLDSNLANLETVVISPASGLTDTGGNVLGGTQAAAEVTVTATGSLAITIDVTETSEGTGYALGTYLCSYDGGADTACEGGYGATSAAGGTAALFIGVTLTGDGLSVVGLANGGLNVTISYQ